MNIVYEIETQLKHKQFIWSLSPMVPSTIKLRYNANCFGDSFN